LSEVIILNFEMVDEEYEVYYGDIADEISVEDWINKYTDETYEELLDYILDDDEGFEYLWREYYRDFQIHIKDTHLNI